MVLWDSQQDFKGQNSLKRLLGSKEQLDWLKIDLNAAKIITAHDYKHKKLVWMEVHIYSSVNAKSRAGVKDITTT